MRKLFSFLAAVGLAVSVAGVGQAGVFDAANSSLNVSLSTLPAINIPGNPGGATSSAGPVVTEFGSPTKAFGPVNVDLPDSLFTGVPQIVDLRINGLDKPGGTGTRQFVAGGGFGGGFGGVAPLSGTATICAFNCTFGVKVPVGLGPVGGGTSAPVFTTALGAPLTISPAAGWTTAVVSITGLGGATPTSINSSGSLNLTSASGQGTVTLVTPVKVNVGAIGQVLPLFVTQTLVFTPEPGTLLLLGTGIVGLAVYGRKRMKA